ncbi:MAG: lysophospholipid acyltransferase family protein [Verrucomicrobiia bacterium]
MFGKATEWPIAAGSRLRRGFQILAFCCAYLIFGFVGTLTSVAGSLLGAVWRGAGARCAGQRLINQLFRFFLWYLRQFKLVNLDGNGLRSLRGSRNLIIVANHPSLLDAVFIIACLPNVCCLMKSDLLRNIVVSGQSKLAGYVDNRSGVGLIKTCQSRMEEGSIILVFPEGTRTLNALNSFRLGFALLAKLSSAPVQTLVIRYDSRFLGKGWPLLRPPRFPLNCSIELGRRFEVDPDADCRAVGSEIEAYFRSVLDTPCR